MRLLFAAFFMQPDDLCDLFRHGHNRIEARHRILENHGNLLAADFAHLLNGEFEQILSVKEDFAGNDFRRRLRQDTHHGFNRGGFACAGFSHKAQRFAVPERKIQVFHGMYRCIKGFEMNRKVFNL